MFHTALIINLFNNAKDALEFTLEKKIKLTAEAAENMIVFEVQDSGCGISPELRDKVFEAFFTTKPVNKGTGIGLSLVQSIIREHDGYIDLESEVGKGTTFRVILPMQDASLANI